MHNSWASLQFRASLTHFSPRGQEGHAGKAAKLLRLFTGDSPVYSPAKGGTVRAGE